MKFIESNFFSISIIESVEEEFNQKNLKELNRTNSKKLNYTYKCFPKLLRRSIWDLCKNKFKNLDS